MDARGPRDRFLRDRQAGKIVLDGVQEGQDVLGAHVRDYRLPLPYRLDEALVVHRHRPENLLCLFLCPVAEFDLAVHLHDKPQCMRNH